MGGRLSAQTNDHVPQEPECLFLIVEVGDQRALVSIPNFITHVLLLDLLAKFYWARTTLITHPVSHPLRPREIGYGTDTPGGAMKYTTPPEPPIQARSKAARG